MFVDRAEAGDRKGPKRGRVARYDRYDYRDGRYRYDRYDYRDRRYFGGRDVVIIRDYYRPYYRPLPRGLSARYYRGEYLPYGWETRVVPVPVYLEPRLVAVPYGYRRGIIDAHAVVYNRRGLILDVAALF